MNVSRRYVIDSNMVQSPELRKFLTDPRNLAVVPRDVWTECYKQGSIEAVRKFLSVIGDFPDQIISLRSTFELAAYDPRQCRFATAFELPDIGPQLRATLAAVDEAERGSVETLERFGELWSDASETMESMLTGASEIWPALPEIAATLSQDELRRCRTRSKYTPDMTEKVFGSAYQSYTMLTKQDGRLPVLQPKYVVQTLYYRISLAMMLHCFLWIEKGSPDIKRMDRLRNDYVDLLIVVCASYYDGLITRDGKAQSLFRELNHALSFAVAAAESHK